MKEYKMSVRLREPYRKHISLLKGMLKEKNNNDLIRRLVDEKMNSFF